MALLKCSAVSVHFAVPLRVFNEEDTGFRVKIQPINNFFNLPQCFLCEVYHLINQTVICALSNAQY